VLGVPVGVWSDEKWRGGGWWKRRFGGTFDLKSATAKKKKKEWGGVDFNSTLGKRKEWVPAQDVTPSGGGDRHTGGEKGTRQKSGPPKTF